MPKLNVGKPEITTQQRVIKLFKEKIGYEYLGNWENRENSNIEKKYLLKFFKKQGYNEVLIKKALYELKKVATNQNKSLYDLNKEVYRLLRYGIKVKESITKNYKTVWLIDWENLRNNDFYIAEEVTVRGKNNKRPDIVLYINGIAVAILELKRSTISVSHGIRQNLDNQKPIFIKQFFATIQLIIAGNDTEGLRYATTETPEKYYLKWKEKSEIKQVLDKDLVSICNKDRLLEIIHDFIVFDFGIKKICRHNQYFGIKAAQKQIKKHKGGIIWHTQGSGKSLMMIWLAKWIYENITSPRVLIITDRIELDEQIENFFLGVDEQIYRTRDGYDLSQKLNNTKPWLICSLIHKFGRKDQKTEEKGFQDFIDQIKSKLPKDFEPKGDVYVFVDECHRTQSGNLNKAMKKIILPKATFIGFTGTPLLKKDKTTKTSREIFGGYIHTYKYDEAVADNVVLDLQYEAREIDQKISSQEKIDQWFEVKTKGLTDYAKAKLKQKWGNLQSVLSSQPRLNRIVNDILMDMAIKPRLANGRGNALLVAGSIYQACQYYDLFQNHGFKKCAIITSYDPSIKSIKGETTGEEDTENIQKYETYQKMIAYYEKLYPEIKTKGFETVIKEKFKKEPGQLKLLIVVDKLLTGFDAPPATYLYIDKSMQDHGLFQAICRVNRLDGDDKEYGYIIDYKDLFKSLRKAVKDYTTAALSGYDREDVEDLLKDRLKTAKQNLDSAIENIKALCEPVKPPKSTPEFIEYFCGNTEKPDDLAFTEQRRHTLYKLASKLFRAYMNIANEMKEAGYTQRETESVRTDVGNYRAIRDEVMLASNEYIDLKQYEPAMRHLIDSYIDAEPSKKISTFEDLTLVDLIIKKGISAISELPKSIRENKNATAETIENNVRKIIIEEKPTNPKYYERMSTLLDEIIRARKQEALEYADYLKRIEKLIKNLKPTEISDKYPKSLDTKAKRALFDNLNNNEKLALIIHEKIDTSKYADWRGDELKERAIKFAIIDGLEEFGITDEQEIKKLIKIIVDLAKNQDEY